MWNQEILSSITLGATATVPIVVALTQIVKVGGWISPKYLPFISILFGILISFLVAHETKDWSAYVLAGILFGLAGSGLYSGLKASANAFQVEQANKRQQNKK